jgi:DNA-3-methyladenine glycosylase II
MYHFPTGEARPIRPEIDRKDPAARRSSGSGPKRNFPVPRTPRVSSPKPEFWDEAVRELGRRDRVLRRLIRAYPDIHLVRRGDPFTTLARAIVGQQISVASAAAVWERVLRAGATPRNTRGPKRLSAERIAATDRAILRTCGLSQRKAEYLCDLAAHFVSGTLDPSRWPALGDEALIEALVDVKGIGRWTAEMFLMFHELRADVLPVDDIGLQRAVALLYNDGERMTTEELRALAAAWQPYRSVATWYLWRSLDPIPVEY